jgi:hypothetical protein
VLFSAVGSGRYIGVCAAGRKTLTCLLLFRIPNKRLICAIRPHEDLAVPMRMRRYSEGASSNFLIVGPRD